MAELMLVNPRKRRKARSPAQRAATRKLVARNRKRKRNPARHTTVARVAPVRRKRRAVARRPVRRRRIRRNPSARGIINTTLIPAAVAGAGALSLDVLWGFVPVPATLKTGPFRHVIKGAGAIGMGYLAGMVVNKKTAGQLATGALTVVMYNAMREMAARFMPNVPFGYVSSGMPVGEYVSGGMGEYVAGDTNPYLANSLTEPFAAPSAVDLAYKTGYNSALESEGNTAPTY